MKKFCAVMMVVMISMAMVACKNDDVIDVPGANSEISSSSEVSSTIPESTIPVDEGSELNPDTSNLDEGSELNPDTSN